MDDSQCQKRLALKMNEPLAFVGLLLFMGLGFYKLHLLIVKSQPLSLLDKNG